MSFHPNEIDKEINKLVSDSISNWENEEVFITDKISFMLRNVIKKCRKNYFGIFNTPKDSATKREKYWVHLTKSLVNAVRNFIDLDTKDIQLSARKPDSIDGARILRHILYSKMSEWNFGEKLNEFLLRLPMDGIGYWKVWREGKQIKDYIVDPLNIYQDPSVEAGELPIVERITMPMSDFEKMDYNNKEYIKGEDSFAQFRLDASQRKTRVKHAILYEYWGEVDKSFITRKSEDKGKIVKDGHIVIGNGDRGTHIPLLAEKKKAPYEALASTKVPNRYLGESVCEKLFGIQEYINEIINIRRNSGLVAQNLLWWVRRGSGIKPQHVAALRAGGTIVSKSPDDFQQLDVNDYRPSSYSDEQSLLSWANRALNFSPQVAGKPLPSSMPATIGLLQQQTSENTFSVIKEDVGLFLKRLFENKFIPLLLQTLTDEEMVKITGEPKDLEDLDKLYVDKLVNREIAKLYRKTGIMPEPAIVDAYKTARIRKLAKQDDVRFVKINKRLLKDVDVEVYVTDESFDKSVVVKQLNDLLLTYSRIAQAQGVQLPVNDIFRYILDLMGLKGVKMSEATTPPPLPQAAQGGSPQQRGIERPQRTTQERIAEQVPSGLGEMLKPTEALRS